MPILSAIICCLHDIAVTKTTLLSCPLSAPPVRCALTPVCVCVCLSVCVCVRACVRVRAAFEAQISHFGQTPAQLFNIPHPARLPASQCSLPLFHDGLLPVVKRGKVNRTLPLLSESMAVTESPSQSLTPFTSFEASAFGQSGVGAHNDR
jgi:hypothetical protein